VDQRLCHLVLSMCSICVVLLYRKAYEPKLRTQNRSAISFMFFWWLISSRYSLPDIYSSGWQSSCEPNLSVDVRLPRKFQNCGVAKFFNCLWSHSTILLRFDSFKGLQSLVNSFKLIQEIWLKCGRFQLLLEFGTNLPLAINDKCN
jgi:hypothetical protein